MFSFTLISTTWMVHGDIHDCLILSLFADPLTCESCLDSGVSHSSRTCTDFFSFIPVLVASAVATLFKLHFLYFSSKDKKKKRNRHF